LVPTAFPAAPAFVAAPAAAPALARRLPARAIVALGIGALALAAALRVAPAHAGTVEVQLQGQDGKPLADAIVFLESREAKAAVKPLPSVEMEQAGKRFTQRAIVVPVGSAVQFPNRDTVRHHVYSLSPTKTFELKLYAGVPANPVVFDRAGVAVLGCNIHDNMVGWVVVVETPYMGHSGRDGRIRIDNVPAGSYRLRSWHPDLPTGAPALDQALAVPASGSAAATVTLPLAGSAAATVTLPLAGSAGG
jgi:plastocyanin